MSDSDCGAGALCIAMQLAGIPAGGHCLLESTGTCPQPMTVVLSNRPSLSGAAAAAYCGIDEALTSCEAILALGNGCSVTTDCAPGGGARCENLMGAGMACTIDCSDDLLCPTGGPAATCSIAVGFCGVPGI